jgi:hypothetical protein
MVIAQARRHPGSPEERASDLARLRQFLDESGTAPARPDPAQHLPVPSAFSLLLPYGLPRGNTLALDRDRYLAAALIGTAVADGGCAALIGADDIGYEAIGTAGAPLSNLVLVDAAGDSWVDAAEALIGAVDLLLIQPPAAPSPGMTRRITARLRRGIARTALLIAGTWPGTARLSVQDARWSGLGLGHGQLQARTTTVTVEGRTTWSRPASVRMLLPAADGTVQPVADGALDDRPPRLRVVSSTTTAA